MNRFKLAGILMIIHGGLMEVGTSLFFGMLSAFNIIDVKSGEHFSFKLDYFQDNLELMLGMGIIFGVVRLIGAIGLLKNRMWGLALSIINCVVTMIIMIFMLPAGIMDGILACSALILILTKYYGKTTIIKLNVAKIEK